MTSSIPDSASAGQGASSALSLHDARAFFEKALIHGIRHGIVPPEKVEAIGADAPKGMVQIARYFGTEFLRPDLERARERMVNLVSLDLLEESGGDLDRAAQMLREHTFLSRSKAGSDRLRRLIALPQSSNFGFLSTTDEPDVQQLSVWSLRSHAEYRAELERRSGIAAAIAAARWFAERLDVDESALEESGAEAEAVVRMGLLWHWMHPAAEAWPHAVSFEKRLSAMRRKGIPPPARLPLPGGLPAGMAAVVDAQAPAVLADAARILDGSVATRTLLRPMGSFRARYFLQDDPLAEVDDYHHGLDALLEAGGEEEGEPAAPASRTWERLTQGHEDEHSLLTLFLCLAAGVPRKTVLTEKAAASLVRRVRRHGWQPALAEAFIRDHAAGARRASYLALWKSFVDESGRTLLDARDERLEEARALLRRECHVVDGPGD